MAHRPRQGPDHTWRAGSDPQVEPDERPRSHRDVALQSAAAGAGVREPHGHGRTLATDAEQRDAVREHRATRANPVTAAVAYVFSLHHELARKTLHILTVVIPLAYASGLPRSILVAVLAVLSVIAVAIELARVRHARTRAAFQRAVGHLLRPHEREQWAGATWLI